MSIAILRPGSHVEHAYIVPFHGRICYEVEAGAPITSMALDHENMVVYRAGGTCRPLGEIKRAVDHRLVLTLPFRGEWYLVLVNQDWTTHTPVYWHVWG